MTFYQTNFSLVQHHKYSLTDIENMMPWEREVYVNMLATHLQKERDRIAEEQRRSNGKRFSNHQLPKQRNKVTYVWSGKVCIGF